MNIFVGNLPYNTEGADLQDLFAPYGAVASAQVLTDRDTGRSRGFGFVEMTVQAEAQAAIEALNGTDFGGRSLQVNEARPRTERAENGGGYRSNGGGGNGGGYGQRSGSGSRGGYGGGGNRRSF